MSLPDRGNFRLNLDDIDDLMIAQWLDKAKNGKKSDVIKQALLAYLSGIVITFDAGNPIDKRIIDAIGHLEDEPHRAAQWMKAKIYERLTGIDATTGEPLEMFVKTVDKVVIQERVKVVRELVPYPVNGTMEAPQIEQPEDDDLTNEAQDELKDFVDW